MKYIHVFDICCHFYPVICYTMIINRKVWRVVMAKKICLSLFLIICVVTASVCAVFAQSVSVDALSGCRKLFAYSGSQTAYFYGFKNATLYSVKVLPQVVTRSATVDGAVMAVCHDETNAYALYQKNGVYGVMTLSHSTGRAVCRTIPSAKNINYHSFAADGNSVYLLSNEGTYTTVVKFDSSGNKQLSYSLPQGAQRLFVNGGRVYCVAYSNEVYLLNGSGKAWCAELNCSETCYDAGVGYIYTQSGKLINLKNGGVRQLSAAFCVQTTDALFESNSGRLFAAVGKKSFTLDDRFRVVTENTATPTTAAVAQSSASSVADALEPPYYDNQTVIAPRDITVKNLQKKYGKITKTANENGRVVTSGKVKTGFTAYIGGSAYTVIVLGDINMTGTVNGADVKKFMEHGCGKIVLSELQRKAADMNQDHAVDNRDLVLLAQSF